VKRKVLICGATGFIGRNLTEAYARRADVEVFASYRQRPPFELPGVTWLKADLTRKDDVERAISGMDVLLQAAATTSGVRTTVMNPSVQIVDNVVMNSYLFAAAVAHGLRNVVFFSCTIMLQSRERPQREDEFDPLAPMHPTYEGAAWTKFYLERMCAYYARRGSTKFTALRHSNVYGPWDKYDLERSHVFGATVTKAMTAADARLLVWGTGEEKRDLLHVDDLVRAVEKSVDRQTSPYAVYNIGLGESVAVRTLVERIVKSSGRDLRIEHDLTKPTVNVSVTLDCSKAKRDLGWTPEISLDAGIRRTVDWWRDHPEARPAS
jgi:nucleoside-diphosphate-sugar epimerase